MIDALIGGRLHGKAARRTGPSGKPFVVCKVRAPMADNEAIFVNCICFDAATGDAMLALDDGDSVALSGSLTPKVYVPEVGAPRPSLDMQVHAVLTAYAVQRRRKAQAKSQQGEGFTEDDI